MSQAQPSVTTPDRLPRQRRPKRDEVQQRLLEGAENAFAKRGFAGASIDLICATAGFSRGAFYSNFPDKEALFFALYDLRINKLYDRVSDVAEKVRHAEHPVQALAEYLRDPNLDELNWNILNKEFIVHALRNAEARDRLITSRRESRTRLTALLIDILPELRDEAEKLERLCRFIIALHEGELTQLGLEPDLLGQPSLMSEFLPIVLASVMDGDA